MTAFLVVLPIVRPESTFIPGCHVVVIYSLLVCNHTSRPSRKVHVDECRTVVLLCEHVIVLEIPVLLNQADAVGFTTTFIELGNSCNAFLLLTSDQVIEEPDVMIMRLPKRLCDSQGVFE
jgi:hypothetical protein